MFTQCHASGMTSKERLITMRDQDWVTYHIKTKRWDEGRSTASLQRYKYRKDFYNE